MTISMCKGEMKTILFQCIVFTCIYMAVMFFTDGIYTYLNVIIFFISTVFFMIGIKSISNQNIKLYNVFMVIYFAFLAINNFNLSGLQEEKSLEDVYFYFIGPMVFALVLCYVEQCNFNIKIIRSKLNGNIICITVLLACIVTKIKILSQTGIRLFSNEWLSTQSDSYTVPTESGLSAGLAWLCLMFIPVTNNKFLKLMMGVTPLVFGLLAAKRGDIMRCMMYLLLLLIYVNKEWFKKRKNIIKLVSIMILLCIFYSVWGNYRQEMRGAINFNLGYYLESRVDNDVINWLYGSTALNFEVLKQLYIVQKPTGDNVELMYPLIRILDGNEKIEKIQADRFNNGLNGFNAGTFLSHFIEESGWLYFIKIAILGLLVGIMDKLCLLLNFIGGHIALLLFTALTIFGNYYINPSSLFPIIFGIIIYTVIDINPEMSNIVPKSMKFNCTESTR